MSDQKEKDTRLSRRKLFSTAGTFLAGAAVTAAGCSALQSKPKAEAAAEPVSWPLPYKKLDPEDVRVRAYTSYYVDA